MALGAALSGLVAGEPVTQERPNIVLIVADDAGFNAFSCHGGSAVQTPRCDALARDGMLLTSFFGQAQCCPSRTQLMTGCDPWRTGTLVNRGVRFSAKRFPLLPTLLTAGGYRCGLFGKWHVGTDESDVGPVTLGLVAQAHFADWLLVGTRSDYYQNPRLWRKDGERNGAVQPGAYGPDVLDAAATAWIADAAKRPEPFFCYVPSPLVHSVPMAKNMPRFDRTVGAIADALDAAGVAGRTLVIVTGDNGNEPRTRALVDGRPVIGGKFLPYDSGCRAAGIVRWPDVVKPGTRCDDLLSFSCVLPTLLAVAGIAAPEQELDGRSFAPQLRGQRGTPRDWVFCFGALRERRWKLYGDELIDCADAPWSEPALTAAQLAANPEAQAAKTRLAVVRDRIGLPTTMLDTWAKAAERRLSGDIPAIAIAPPKP